jgi:hypothetical protein
MATKTKSRFVTIKQAALERLANHETRGEYDFPRQMSLYRVTAGPLVGRHVLADHGFAWHGQSGGYSEQWYLLDQIGEPVVARLSTLIEVGDLCEAQQYIYGLSDPMDWPRVTIR